MYINACHVHEMVKWRCRQRVRADRRIRQMNIIAIAIIIFLNVISSGGWQCSDNISEMLLDKEIYCFNTARSMHHFQPQNHCSEAVRLKWTAKSKRRSSAVCLTWMKVMDSLLIDNLWQNMRNIRLRTQSTSICKTSRITQRSHKAKTMGLFHWPKRK